MGTIERVLCSTPVASTVSYSGIAGRDALAPNTKSSKRIVVILAGSRDDDHSQI